MAKKGYNMEIIFDNNSEYTFQGKEFPIINLDTDKNLKISQMYHNVKELIAQNSQNPIIIIKPSAENNNLHLYAALFGIENNNDNIFPSCAVIKVNNHQQAMTKHEPYMYFTTAATYAYRLSQMNITEMYKDIETLGYLGLDIKTDYLQNLIIMRHPSDGRKYFFKSNRKNSSIVLAGLIKILSLMKIKPPLDINIHIKKSDDKSTTDFCLLLNKLLWCCKLLFNPKNFS